jgi:hypothetical protein
MISSALSSALAGIRYQEYLMDRAARAIAGIGPVEDTPPSLDPTPQPAASDPPMDLPEAMVTMLIAQRAFAAQLRVVRTAEDMARETLRLMDHGGDR